MDRPSLSVSFRSGQFQLGLYRLPILGGRAFVRKNEELKKRVFLWGCLFNLFSFFKKISYFIFFVRSHSWSLVVTQREVTHGHSKSLVVTRDHSWSLVCSFSEDLHSNALV